MPYKVFFVEDEIVTREGIRDNVDWQATALSSAAKPRRRDGLAAFAATCTRCADHRHQDAVYGRSAALQDRARALARDEDRSFSADMTSLNTRRRPSELGVTEYLFKPVTVQDLHRALRKLAVAARPGTTRAGKTATGCGAGGRKPGACCGKDSCSSWWWGGFPGGRDRESAGVGH